ncbi:MAG: ADP-ribosylglycohydrolase family protein [Clostridia bacterium]|nr:ADP-ribosylglycohydrolase family protein [Clostridia bacterium]
MLGAIIGDLAGTKYEFQEFLDSRKGIINLERRKSILDPNMKLITENSFISDDSILTIAIAESIIYNIDYEQSLKKYGKKYGNKPNNRKGFFKNAFSPTFIKWANADNHEKGISQGNGSAMRVSFVGYLFNSLSKVQSEAKKSAIPSHNSPQAIKRCSGYRNCNIPS